LLADGAITAIVKAAVPDETLRDLNVDSLDASSLENAGSIIGRVSALPFLAQRRVVIVRGSIDLKKDDRDEIVIACEDVPEHAVLVVDHSGRPARPQGRKPKDEAAAFAAGTKGSTLLDCTLSASEAARFVDECATAAGVKVDADAREMLAATEDASEIKNALDRLALTTKRVKVADVRDYQVSPQEAKLWDLADAVHDRRVDRALALAREFFDSPVGPLQWLAGDAQVIWELSAGARPDEYARSTGQNAWRIGKLTGAARRITPAAARRNVDITMKALEKCITGKREPVQTLEEVIVRLCETPK
jgi:DNA polymerase III delta subunit